MTFISKDLTTNRTDRLLAAIRVYDVFRLGGAFWNCPHVQLVERLLTWQVSDIYSYSM